jgi:sucrose phosphorylase
LATLKEFADKRLTKAFSAVHLLPFYPWSSDDGFSVIDYRKVNPDSGEWRDVERLGENFDLMFDLVLNHCSRQSSWFRDFVAGVEPARKFFITESPKTDLSQVVRPRTSPLLTKTTTREGTAHVWTTFSADQVDLNWQNPDVLFEFLDILFYYIAKGAKIIRLDAVAFLWKEIGTSCIHLPETHEMVKLLRDVVEFVAPEVILITETNVPQPENLSYFGEGDEAHMVYNFSLPPLLLHAILTGDASHLTKWAMELPEPPEGTTYFNFTASHDGIGVRPITGLLPEGTLEYVEAEVKKRGGLVSYRSQSDGSQTPYELNITYLDACRDLERPEHDTARFLLSQTLAMSLRGLPALYIHSLLGTPNYHEGVKESQHNRTINRRKWQIGELQPRLDDSEGEQGQIFKTLVTRLNRRSKHPAFHPDGSMEVFDVGSALFVVLRRAPDGSETILCLYNFTGKAQLYQRRQLPAELSETSQFQDIIGGRGVKVPEKGVELSPYQCLWLLPKES